MENSDAHMRPDANVIRLSKNHEVRYWTQVFGVTRSDLEQAILVVGSDARAVREHLEARAVNRLDSLAAQTASDSKEDD